MAADLADAALTRLARPRRLVLGKALVIPDLLLLALVFVLPMLLLVGYSFLRINLYTKALILEPNLDSYAAVGNPVYLTSVVRSVGVSVLVATVCLIVGLPYAYAMTQVSKRNQMLLLVGVVIPYYTSGVVRTYAWLSLLGPHGPVSGGLAHLHVVATGTDLRYTMFAVVLGMTYSYLPLMILPLYVALERLDRTLLDAAGDLGLNRVKTFYRVVIPSAAPGIVAGLILIGIPALGEYTIPAILGGNKILLMGNVIVNEFQATGNYPMGSALATVLMAATIAILVVSALVTSLMRKARAR